MNKLIGFLLCLLLSGPVNADEVILRPDADSSVAFTKAGAGCTGGSNFDCIDEVSADDDTTYNTSSDNGGTDTDLFNFTDGSIDSGATIDTVVLTCRAKDTGGGNNKLIIKVVSDSTYNAASAALGTGYADITHDVSGLQGWEPGDFDGTLVTIGYEADGNGAAERRVTQCFLTVNFTLAGAGGVTGRRRTSVTN